MSRDSEKSMQRYRWKWVEIIVLSITSFLNVIRCNGFFRIRITKDKFFGHFEFSEQISKIFFFSIVWLFFWLTNNFFFPRRQKVEKKLRRTKKIFYFIEINQWGKCWRKIFKRCFWTVNLSSRCAAFRQNDWTDLGFRRLIFFVTEVVPVWMWEFGIRGKLNLCSPILQLLFKQIVKKVVFFHILGWL